MQEKLVKENKLLKETLGIVHEIGREPTKQRELELHNMLQAKIAELEKLDKHWLILPE